MAGRPELTCPLLEGSDGARQCLWPGLLSLDLSERGGRFSLPARAYTESALILPGGAGRWPAELLVDGKPAVLLERGGRPALQLLPGDHLISGRLLWRALPASLEVPTEIGLVALTLNGRPIRSPNRDSEGRLWLREGEGQQEEESALTLALYRKLEDETPMILTTRLKLEVAGKNRELLLGPALPRGFVPMALSGSLPAKLEPDGRLRVQARPGTYELELLARATGNPQAIALEAVPEKEGADWPDEELWVFEAHRELRTLSIEGVSAIEPGQTTLPDEWRSFPAYRVGAGQSMRLVEVRRGDSEPTGGRLEITRELWLDYDGGGYTARDRIEGTLTRPARLELNEGGELGRVSLSGLDQLITRGAGSARAGVEVPRGALVLDAVSRLAREGALSAGGWARDFEKVELELHLPPGWRLFAAPGVDQVPGSWFQSWTLLDLFLALVIAVAIGKLWGVPWGAVALLALAATLPEEGAPKWSWLWFLAAEGIARLLSDGKLKRFVAIVRAISLFVIVLGSVTFLAGHIRMALYPSLGVYGSEARRDSASNLAQRHFEDGGADEEVQELAAAPSMEKRKMLSTSAPSAAAKRRAPAKAFELDPAAKVQTGPGLPAWHGTVERLIYSGPVEQGEQLRLLLLSPNANRLLAFVRLALLALLLLRILFGSRRFKELALRPAKHASALLSLGIGMSVGLGLGAALLAAPSPARAQIPSKELLEELRERLSKPPPCAPHCATIDSLELNASPEQLGLTLQVGAQVSSAIPLPGGAEHWNPVSITVDGAPARALWRGDDQQLWLPLAPGRHRVELAGPPPQRSTFQLPLPLRPHHVIVRADGFRVDGVHEDGGVDGALQLTRVAPAVAEGGERGATNLFPPLVRLSRTLALGLTWGVETRVERLTPADSAVVLELPLLPGESVTTPGVRVEGGRVLLNLPPGAVEMRWSSTLAKAERLELVAASNESISELWELDAKTLWHVEAEGFAPIHHEGYAAMLYRPRAGERLRLSITRPVAVEGRTATIERAALEVTPGNRASGAELKLTIRASQGGEQRLTFPEGALLERVSLQGVEQPLRLEGRSLAVPLSPGLNRVEIGLRLAEGISLRYAAPEIDLGGPAVNASVAIHPSGDRWLLFVGGPMVGPVLQLWSYLVFFILLAVLLGRYAPTPLKIRHWILLALGLCQAEMGAGLLVAGWLLLLAFRQRQANLAGLWRFRLLQLAVGAMTFIALVSLGIAISEGLLGRPEMHVGGNGSSAAELLWSQDRVASGMPTPWLVSVPLYLYRAAMLAWSAWLAIAVLKWLRWGWGAFSAGGYWRSKARPQAKPAPLATELATPGEHGTPPSN